MAQETPTSTHALLDMERRGLRHLIAGITPPPSGGDLDAVTAVTVPAARTPAVADLIRVSPSSIDRFSRREPTYTQLRIRTTQTWKLQSVTGAGALERLYVYDVWAY